MIGKSPPVTAGKATVGAGACEMRGHGVLGVRDSHPRPRAVIHGKKVHARVASLAENFTRIRNKRANRIPYVPRGTAAVDRRLLTRYSCREIFSALSRLFSRFPFSISKICFVFGLLNYSLLRNVSGVIFSNPRRR